MRNFSKIILSIAIPVLGAAQLSASPITGNRDRVSHKYRTANRHMLFKGDRYERINRINAMLDKKEGPRKETETRLSPSHTITDAASFQDLDGPNGKLWFYKADFKTMPMEVSEYFTEHIMLEYTFTIYDENLKIVGTVHDKVRYENGEWLDRMVELTPVVTRNYFNQDDNYEVIVSLALNVSPGHNNYRNYVYSLGGEKETVEIKDPLTGEMISKEVEVDKPVRRLDSSIVDVLDASTANEENFYFTFYDEHFSPDLMDTKGEAKEGTDEDYWEKRVNSKLSYKVLGKFNPNVNGGHPEVHKFSTGIMNIPGDMENTPPFISFVRDGVPYFATSWYKEPFWNPYYSIEEDLTMREVNSLMVNIYRIENNSATLVQETEIPFVKDSDPKFIASFFSVGDLMYRGDIDYGHFTQDGKASFFVTKKNSYAGGETYEYNYYVYDPAGTKIKTLFEHAESRVPLADIEGFEPQQVFIEKAGDIYQFSFIDLYSGSSRKPRFVIPSQYVIDEDSDPESLKANLDRVPKGDSYEYGIELGTLGLSENEDNFLRILWLDNGGNYSHIEEINLGKNVMLAQCWIDGAVLRPTIFNDDIYREYMLLIKRGVNGKTEEEFVVTQAANPTAPEGKHLLHLTPGEKGILHFIELDPSEENAKLMVTWNNNYVYTKDFYFLPFASSAVDEIRSADAAGEIAFNGTILTAPGMEIKVYNLQGIGVAAGFGTVDASVLPAGLYIATAGDNVRKFVVR